MCRGFCDGNLLLFGANLISLNQKIVRFGIPRSIGCRFPEVYNTNPFLRGAYAWLRCALGMMNGKSVDRSNELDICMRIDVGNAQAFVGRTDVICFGFKSQ